MCLSMLVYCSESDQIEYIQAGSQIVQVLGCATQSAAGMIPVFTEEIGDPWGCDRCRILLVGCGWVIGCL